MSLIFPILTIISIIALLTGFVWLLVSRGSVEQRSGPEVGAQVMGAIMDDDDEGGIGVSTSRQRTAFRGQGTQVSVEAGYSYTEIKDQLAEGHWRQVAPALLTIGGMFGLLFFGALTLFLTLEERWLGILLLVIVAYAVIRVTLGFARA